MSRRFLMAVSATVASVVLLMFWWPSLVLFPLQQSSPDEGGLTLWGDMTRMLAPRHVIKTGTTTYELRADGITLIDEHKDFIALEQLRIKAVGDNGEHFELSAGDGRYHRQTQQLHLSGWVVFSDEQGRKWRTKKAVMLLDEGVVRGDAPVEAGWGERMTLLAEGFYMNEKADEWRLLGTTRMRFLPQDSG